MLPSYSIKYLYALALAEGEGMGTAYEYYAKRLLLNRWLSELPRPGSILIAGLPERYGASLDFILLAMDLDAQITVVDDRPDALRHLNAAIETLSRNPGAPQLTTLSNLSVVELGTIDTFGTKFDLALTSEVLQRLDPARRQAFLSGLVSVAHSVALFSPNAGNGAHTTISGLASIHLDELRILIERATTHDAIKSAGAKREYVVGYVDMPPFPPGITRSEAQRVQASQGWFESAAMWGLARYARLEKYLPKGLRSRQAHIVYALVAA